MDACHLLQRKPWQYARRTIHNERKNTCTLSKDGKKFQLLPLREQELQEVLLFSRVVLECGARKKGVLHPIAQEDGEEYTFEVTTEVRKLLEEYNNIARKYLLHGLPQRRKIVHQILGARLPN